MVSEGPGKGDVMLLRRAAHFQCFLLIIYSIAHTIYALKSPIFANCLRNRGERTSTFVGRGQVSDGIMIIRGSPDRYSLPKRDEPYQKGTHAAQEHATLVTFLLAVSGVNTSIAPSRSLPQHVEVLWKNPIAAPLMPQYRLYHLIEIYIEYCSIQCLNTHCTLSL